MNWLILSATFVGGMIVAGLFFVLGMRNMMIESEKVEGSFEEVCGRIEAAIEATEGWGMPTEPEDLSEMLEEKGHELQNVKRIRNYNLCKAPYAARILDEFPFIAAMMPCSWAVYERASGEVYVAKMNIPVMSKMFAGNTIGQVMSKVGREEKEMMREVHST